MSKPKLNPLEIKGLLNQYHSELRKLEYQIHQTKSIIQELESQAAELQEALSPEDTRALPAAAGKPQKGKKRAGRPTKAKAAATGADAGKTAEKEAEIPAAEPRETEAVKEGPPAAETGKPATGRPRGKRTAKKDTAAARKKPGRPLSKAGAKKAGKSAEKGAGYRLSYWDKFVIESLRAKGKSLIASDFVDIAKEDPDIKEGEAQVKVKLNRSLHKLSNKKDLLEKVEYSGRGYAYALPEWLDKKGDLPKKYAR